MCDAKTSETFEPFTNMAHVKKILNPRGLFRTRQEFMKERFAKFLQNL